MLLIYQRASKVVAWLGVGEACMGEIVKAQDNEAFHYEDLCKAHRHLYTRL
jgi:hypothetical protein